MTVVTEASPDRSACARFTRRLLAVFLDAIVLMLLLAGALIVAVAFKSDNIALVLEITLVAVWLLYEPVLVSTAGGTIGHYVYNMRVVDDRGGNVSFGKAVARMIIKSVLGWYSFVAMALTSRHQAVHDLLTRSTVQMRDVTTARPHHFAGRREDLTGPGMPSRNRRILVIFGYALAGFILLSSVIAILGLAGIMSHRCVSGGACSVSEAMIRNALRWGWFGTSILALIQGWRGRLWGARAEH